MKRLRRIGQDKGRNPLSEYECDCGNVFTARDYDVKSGHTESCGCKKINNLKNRGDMDNLKKSIETREIVQKILNANSLINDRRSKYYESTERTFKNLRNELTDRLNNHSRQSKKLNHY